MHTRSRLTHADRLRLAAGGALAVGIVAAAGLALAQQPRRTLHQELPLADRKPTPLIGAGGSGNPAAMIAGNKILTEPPAEPRKSGEPMLGQGGFAADRQTSMTPDSNTGADGTLHYVSVFNPDVLPFKRMSSFDAVAATSYKLFVGRTAQVTLPVIGTADTDKLRDRFWGSLMIELSPGKDIPLPSVAPDMRILSYETKPPVRLEFSKDGADNFYVRAANPSTSAAVRLTFLVDADAGYFAPSLPTTSRRLTPGLVEQAAPNEIRPNLPADVRANAELTLRKLRINRDMPLSDAFNALVGYFRAFQAKPLPSTGDIYRDLCDTKAGVCRHRSFAFMITANAVGIPTRYVQNEAHAFVEVWFPEREWQRIDLGGAALRMDVQNANDKTLHRPRADDPFAKPPEYRNNYTQLEGQISGLTQQQIDDKRASLDDAPASGVTPDLGGSGGGSGGTGDQTAPDPGLPVATHDPKKATPVLEVLEADASGYRGAAVRIAGRAHVRGKALPNHPIDVYLSLKGADGKGFRHIGRAVTTADGTFRQEFSVPADLGLATYEIWLGSPSDAYYNNALSQ
ncbi:MAG TPA: transglutaminase domain-containing protein [Kofleriaceae bacterium]|nr:transglutaminase domain-containing protein [Kofleriaceae bacterium]